MLKLAWAAVIFLAVIGVGMVVRRALALAGIGGSFTPPGQPAFDGGFAKNPVLTYTHILPASVYIILSILQLAPGIRRRYIAFHRASGRIALACGYITGVTALVMAFKVPIGGFNEAVATTVFGLYFLFSLTRGLQHILHGRAALHRQWMLRAFAIALAVATVRPVIGLFFAFSGLPPQQFFGTAFWLGFTLHLIAVEWWLRRHAGHSGAGAYGV